MSQPALKNPLRIAPFLSIIVMLFFANGCYSSYKERRNELKNIPLLETMIKDNTVAIAKVDPGYKEVTMKIMGMPMKYYEVTYSYEVGGSSYDGERTLSSPPTAAVMPLYYAKSNPSYSSFEPELDIKRIKEKASSNSKLYWSIGFVLLAVGVAAHFVSQCRDYVKARRIEIAAEEAARGRVTNY